MNCGAEDILRGNPTITLGLMWSIVHKFQFKSEAKGKSTAASFSHVSTLISLLLYVSLDPPGGVGEAAVAEMLPCN